MFKKIRDLTKKYDSSMTIKQNDLGEQRAKNFKDLAEVKEKLFVMYFIIKTITIVED